MKLARQDVSSIRDATDFSRLTRLTVGLINMGVTDDKEIAAYFIAPGDSAWHRIQLRYATNFIAKVRRSKIPAIVDAIEFCLPSAAAIELPYFAEGRKVWCKSCNSHVNVVPCPLCYTRQPVRTPVKTQCKTPPLPESATKYEPGTTRKILVMQQRYENGFAIFHPDDTVR